MNSPKKVINDLLVEVFNHILSIEGSTLKSRGVTLSMNEVHVLEAIEKTLEPTMSNIARRLRVTVGTLTTAMNRLVQKGYCTRYSELEDRRKVLIKLTDKAYDVLKIHNVFHDEMIDAVFADMQLEKDQVLLQSLENISDYFKNKY
ncbi:MarR family transcriptional regulator [Candidatus Izimaplasma bacterium ZiA1]|uniref:MarR family winged helix-turn-helix transcriptional regulator n=1 Tax=Candidatus Izimoplasma sp. ZiA1 TaxID=2024899 RepID=UPI000BAA4FE6|nr:MarR family transcriptional regulator [Candidatus Izimaplasma bacterium ZiA1]